MSSIKLKHSSGNSMSIEAPATNPASDLAIKLPATIGTAGQVLKNSSTAGTLEFGTSAGITMADQWRQSTWHTTNDSENFLTSDWEQVDTGGQGTLGSALTESSGIFTFPSTGIWHVSAHARARSDGALRTYLEIEIDVGSTTHAIGTTDMAADQHYATCHCEQHVDVSDTSTKTVRIQIASNNTITVLAGTTTNQTYIVFTRLGDT